MCVGVIEFGTVRYALSLPYPTPSESASPHLPTATDCLLLRLLPFELSQLLASPLSHHVNEDMALPDDDDAVGDPARRCDLRHAPAAV